MIILASCASRYVYEGEYYQEPINTPTAFIKGGKVKVSDCNLRDFGVDDIDGLPVHRKNSSIQVSIGKHKVGIYCEAETSDSGFGCSEIKVFNGYDIEFTVGDVYEVSCGGSGWKIEVTMSKAPPNKSVNDDSAGKTPLVLH